MNKAPVLSAVAGLWAVAVLLTLLTAARGENPQGAAQENIKTFMRAKLAQSQTVLEGLTTGSFDKIAAGAKEMTVLSQAAQWQVIQSQEYARRSGDFRQEAEALAEAAKKKNLDGATLAYIRLTMSCIECHKYVRGVREARLPDSAPGPHSRRTPTLR